jgi:hypothetical protein
MVGKSFKNILTDKIENHEAEDYFQAMDLSDCLQARSHAPERPYESGTTF